MNSLLREACIILGDYNSTTHHSHATTLTTNLWLWLIVKERSRALSDLLIPFTTTTPYTRVRRFAGAKSYIDRAYGIRLYQASCSPWSAEALDFSEVHGASDHDPIIIRSIPWTTPQSSEPRCAHWNRRDMQRFRSLMEWSHHVLQTPTCLDDATIRQDSTSARGRQRADTTAICVRAIRGGAWATDNVCGESGISDYRRGALQGAFSSP